MAIIFIRTVIVFVAILISMRIMGKRQLGELELSELVVAVLISDMAAHPLQDIGVPLINGLVPIITLLCCELLITAGTVKSIRFRVLMCGKPSMIVENGKINQREMEKNRFTIDELTEELRKQSVTDISKIKYAILETNGSLNIILFPAETPVTPAVMNISVPDPGMPIIVINNGRVLDNNLKILGLDQKWLSAQLKTRKIKDASEVFLMMADDSKQIYFAAKEVE